MYRVSSSELRHLRNSFEVTESMQVYISWRFHSLLLTYNVSAPFSPPYRKVSLTVFVVLYCSVAYTVHEMTRAGRTLQLVKVLDSVLRHCFIPQFLSEPSEFHVLLMFQDLIDFVCLFTFQTPVSLPIIWAGLELISQEWILEWNFQYILFADSE